jgi:two-component system sensor histidine kinase BaeS
MVWFSKFFFLLFTLLTIIPLLALFGWSRYQAEEFMSQRQENAVAFGQQWISQSFTQYLQQEKQYLEGIQKSLPNFPLTLSAYQSLFDTDDVTVQDVSAYHGKPPVDYVLLTHPKTHQQVPAIRFIVPAAASTRHVWVIHKPISYARFQPPGDYVVSLYAGTQALPPRLLQTLNAPLDALGGVPQKSLRIEKRSSHPPRRVSEQSDGAQTRFFALKALDGSTIMTVRLNSPYLMRIQKEQQKNGFWLTIIILVSGCLSTLLAGKYLNKNFIEPLMLLSVATKKVQQGERKVQVETEPINQPDVLATLENFNQMIQKLEEQDALKNNFISNLTHDLRTPLIAQERTLELLIRKGREMPLEEQLSFFEGMLKNNRHLLGMINHILDTYRYEQGTLHLAFEPVQLAEIVSQSFSQLGALADEHAIQLVHAIPADLPVIYADPHCLLRVFNNLVGNAIENIPQGSRVEISGRLLDDRVEIHVRDNGQGLPEAVMKDLFDRYSGGLGDTRKIGTGLGLYICKLFIEAHHGTLTVESEPEQFTDFKIELPIQGAQQLEETE